MYETERCPVCLSGGISTLKEHLFRFPGDDVKGNLRDATYTRLWILFERIIGSREDIVFKSMICGFCGLIFTNPRYTEDDLRIKYQTIEELGSVKYRLSKNPPFNLEKRAERICRLVYSAYRSPKSERASVLDYGGASGYSLVPFTEKHRCYVLDYEKWDLPEGVEYLGRDLGDLDPGARFEIILLLHTLEHVTRPGEFLKDLTRYLSPEGIIYLEVPLGCFREWNRIPEPLTHVNFFSEESLSRCVELSGMNIVHLSTAYQWITHGNMWCVNIIAQKGDPRTYPGAFRPLSTRQQMHRPRYYLRCLLDPRVLCSLVKRFAGV